MSRDLTNGAITKELILFSLPMMAGNFLQQLYNIADTVIVGRVVGANALAAVGSAYALMTFLFSVFMGLAMGAAALFSIYWGRGDMESFRCAVAQAFRLTLCITLVLNVAVYLFLPEILNFLQIPELLYEDMRIYLEIIFGGILATFLYDFLACLLRAAGDSVTPLIFLAVAAVLNIGLDLLLILRFSLGIAGAGIATVVAQYVAGVGLGVYTLCRRSSLLPQKHHWRHNRRIMTEIRELSLLTSMQQSAMNFGILLVQRLVDSFGPVTMAAFAAAVKIDTFAYLPVQDFGNAFSTFVAQNYGAENTERIHRGLRRATLVSVVFSCMVSLLVFVLAPQLMGLFVSGGETAVIASGVGYLRIEGACYAGIGCLFLLYGFYRGIKKPGMSLLLTVISLGLRVFLAYALCGVLGENGIWIAIPIGWLAADLTGYGYYMLRGKILRKPSRF